MRMFLQMLQILTWNWFLVNQPDIFSLDDSKRSAGHVRNGCSSMHKAAAIQARIPEMAG